MMIGCLRQTSVLILVGGGVAAAQGGASMVEPFDLSQVRLLDGPFKDAMQRNAEYLLRLEPDRLLSGFREEAGLEPRAEKYGGWESGGVAGHTLGHYLSACAMTYAATGDREFRRRVAYIVDELDECQRALGSGYVAGLPEGKRVFQEVAAGDIRSEGFGLNGGWVPFYTLHKLFAGLRDAHHLCGNANALSIAIGLADFIEQALSGLTEEQMQTVLACEHGGMNEVLADLYADTDDGRTLALSRRFHHKAVLDPLLAREDRLEGLHGNTQIPKLIGLARRYEVAGDLDDRRAAEFFWDRVVNHHSYATGGHSDSEHFGPPDMLAQRLGQNTTETCNTYNMLKLTKHVFGWNPTSAVADYYERALYNHILASQDPETGMVCYYLTLKPGRHKVYSTPFDSFWCCVGTGIENHARYGEAIYFHDDRSIYVNLFVASEVRWPERGFAMQQLTDCPEAGRSRFTFRCDEPVDLTVRIRKPYWAEQGIDVSINGEPVAAPAGDDGYIGLHRRWRSGDRVEVTMPMSLHLHPMPDDPKRVAVMYGPLVLAGELGPENDPAASDHDYVPVFVTEGKALTDWLTPVVDEPNAFETNGVGRPREVRFRPFYRLHGERYSVYWDLFTAEQWEDRQEEYRAERERLARLEAITIDSCQPGEMQPERDHNMQGENTRNGEHLGRKWRDASEGWFSLDMAVSPDEPVTLICTYWGSEGGARTFDLLVDGEVIETRSLGMDKPGEFFDVRLELPEELTRGREQVTVRFQSHPGNMAGGCFGLRTVRTEDE